MRPRRRPRFLSSVLLGGGSLRTSSESATRRFSTCSAISVWAPGTPACPRGPRRRLIPARPRLRRRLPIRRPRWPGRHPRRPPHHRPGSPRRRPTGLASNGSSRAPRHVETPGRAAGRGAWPACRPQADHRPDRSRPSHARPRAGWPRPRAPAPDQPSSRCTPRARYMARGPRPRRPPTPPVGRGP
jgi:hypothetical protein